MTKCDHCEKRAVSNFQKVWVKWPMTKDGYYSIKPEYGSYATGKMNEWDEPTGNNNIHVCEEHEEQLLNGELDF